MLYTYLCYPLWGGVHDLSALYDANEVRIWKNGVMDFFVFTFLTF